MIPYIQMYAYLGLSLLAFGVQIWAMVSSWRFTTSDYVAAGKSIKIWQGILIPVAIIGFCSIPPPIGLGLPLMLLNVAAVVAAAVYLTDARPALIETRANRKRGYGRGSTGGW